MSKHKIIFIGPIKTGSTWIHEYILQSKGSVKELYFPARFFTQFVYSKYVKNEQILVWPYLLLFEESLLSLLTTLKKNGHTFDLICTCRPRQSWLKSRARFYQRSKATIAEEDNARDDLKKILNTYRKIASKYKVKHINIWKRDKQTIDLLQSFSGQEEHEVIRKLDTKSYETNSKSIVPTRLLGVLYFRIKPFLPRSLQTVTRQQLKLQKPL